MAERTTIGIYYLPEGANEEIKLMVDAVLTINHKASSDITEHTVEDGTPVADNMVPKAVELELSCLVTNAPLDQDEVRNTRSSEAWLELENIRISKQVVAVITGFRVYENMGILALSAPEDFRNGDCLRYTVSLRQIRKASLETVVAPKPAPVKPNLKPKDDKGTKGKEEPEEKEEDWFDTLSDYIGGETSILNDLANPNASP